MKASSEAKYSFGIKSHTGEDMGNFTQKSVPSLFRKRLREYVEADW